MTRTNADETAFDRAIRNDATVKMVCGCTHESSYAGFSDFNRARLDGHIEVITDGEFDWAFANGQFQATCPTCGGKGETAKLTRNPHDTILIEMESALPDRNSNRTNVFSPTASLSDKRTKYTEILEQNPPLEISCGCGFTNQFLEFHAFLAQSDIGKFEFNPEGDHLPYALAGDQFTLICPECGGTGHEATLLKQRNRFIIQIDIRRADTCPSCDAYIHEDGFKQGPEAPEIGWEYYECPDCNARARHDAVKTSDD